MPVRNAPRHPPLVNNRPVISGVLSIEFDQVDVTAATEPDPRWQHIDAQGHFHAYDEKMKLPTLETRVEEIECDGACGDRGCTGFTITHYHCVICGEEVKPGVRDAVGRTYVPGLMHWSVTVEDEVDQLLPLRGQTVSIRMSDHGYSYFGVGVVSELRAESGRAAQATIQGTSQLGRRKAA